MSAVSKKLMPSSIAASTTACVAARSMRPPKLLHPRPTTETDSCPILRVSTSAETSVNKMDIGRVGIWTGALDTVPSSEAQRLAGQLEELGFPTLWIPETVG